MNALPSCFPFLCKYLNIHSAYFNPCYFNNKNLYLVVIFIFYVTGNAKKIKNKYKVGPKKSFTKQMVTLT